MKSPSLNSCNKTFCKNTCKKTECNILGWEVLVETIHTMKSYIIWYNFESWWWTNILDLVCYIPGLRKSQWHTFTNKLFNYHGEYWLKWNFQTRMLLLWNIHIEMGLELVVIVVAIHMILHLIVVHKTDNLYFSYFSHFPHFPHYPLLVRHLSQIIFSNFMQTNSCPYSQWFHSCHYIFSPYHSHQKWHWILYNKS